MNKFSIWRRKLAPWGKWLKTAGVIGLVGIIGVIGIIGMKKIWRTAGSWLKRPFSTISTLADPASALQKIDGRTNILILGKGNQEHEAADLTDTIMVVSIRLEDQRVNIISIPRDIWIDSMRAKINTAYYYGQQKNSDGGGAVLIKDAVYQVTGLPIQYAIVVDFDGFVKAIDLVGGIDVEVERSFTDEKYPLEGENGDRSEGEEGLEVDKGQYETVKFEEGWQKMDGETALKYSRSRYSTDPMEGTDFARSLRQQKVLLALAAKVKSRETVLNMERIKELQDIFNQYTETNLTDEELLALGRIGMKIKIGEISQIKIDEGTKDEPGLLVNPPLYKYGQWVLVSRTGDWERVKEYIRMELDK